MLPRRSRRPARFGYAPVFCGTLDRRSNSGARNLRAHEGTVADAFDDAEKLLAAALELGLEGIVSKKRDRSVPA
jgi:hypothetical protein